MLWFPYFCVHLPLRVCVCHLLVYAFQYPGEERDTNSAGLLSWWLLDGKKNHDEAISGARPLQYVFQLRVVAARSVDISDRNEPTLHKCMCIILFCICDHILIHQWIWEIHEWFPLKVASSNAHSNSDKHTLRRQTRDWASAVAKHTPSCKHLCKLRRELFPLARSLCWTIYNSTGKSTISQTMIWR